MKNYKVLFADLDGTLIETLSGETFPKGIWDMKFKFDVLDAIKNLAPEYLIIVTNQGGIESGHVDYWDFVFKIRYITRAIQKYVNNIISVKYKFCNTNDENDTYRKPNIGMLVDGIASIIQVDSTTTLKFEKTDMLMIGDASGKKGQWSDIDKKTAENFGIDYLDVEDFVNIYKTE